MAQHLSPNLHELVKQSLADSEIRFTLCFVSLQGYHKSDVHCLLKVKAIMIHMPEGLYI